MEHDHPTDAELITYAGRFYRRPGAREQAVRAELRLSATRFWQLVIAVLDSPGRIAALPQDLWPVVKRLDEERLRRMPKAG
ncbi:DUF3263 domain-containing protein [Jatrophihabitans sp.]|uniref:DUF3263 domain-containing protein n=1 Tax=Jatrophihabitans sp. TaxID=1932789 RepID=UPI0030C7347A|nr:hypothetical protein [Jatrophihabitans sp.]